MKMILNRSSKLFQPIIPLQKNTNVVNHDLLSKSSQLMLNNGIIKQSSPGLFHFLPIGIRVLDKLIKLIDLELQNINAQKVMFPSLTHSKLWKASGRLQDVTNELFKVKDRHDTNYILSPTHEEASTDLITSLGLVSYKKYPLKLYQITSKFRDEMKPRFGLMRARQFIMKDLYSFDIDVEHSKQTYDEMNNCYAKIFDNLSIPWVRVVGSSGTMGGDLSHEFHLPAEIGEDKLVQCLACNYSANLEYIQSSQSGSEKTKNESTNISNVCPKCSSHNVNISSGIEVGHTFLLGDKYSKALNCKYLADDGKAKLLQMGSYGLGVSRIIAAAVEILSEEVAIKWPAVICPFRVVLIGPKAGSKEESKLTVKPEDVYHDLNNLSTLVDDVLYDDRAEMTIGKRLLEAKRTGYPFAIVCGGKAAESPPLFEVINLYNAEQQFLSLDQLRDYFSNWKIDNLVDMKMQSAKC